MKSPSGMIFIPVEEGSGASPQATDTVKVHYKGTLRDGSVFDSSVQRGQPAAFPARRIVTTTPVVDGRSFGTNLLEAALVAVSGRRLSLQELDRLIDEVGLFPQIQELD